MALYSLYCAEVPLRNCSLTRYRQADRIAHVQWHVHAIAYMLSCVEILCICLSSSNIHSAHFSKLWSILHGNAVSAADTYLWHIAFSVLSWHWCIAWLLWAAVIHCSKAWLLCRNSLTWTWPLTFALAVQPDVPDLLAEALVEHRLQTST